MARLFRLILERFLQELHATDQATSDQLTVLENAVSDPGLRALLRMERLLKEAQQSST